MVGAGKNSFAWFGPRPRVTLMNPGLIKDVLTKIYDFRKPNTNPLTRVLVTGLVNHEEEKWAKHRRIINPAFHLKKLEVIFNYMMISSCSNFY